MQTYTGSYIHLPDEWIIICRDMSKLTPLKEGEF